MIDFIRQHNSTFDRLAYLIAAACLYHDEHPISSIRRAFANIDDTLGFLEGDVSEGQYINVLEAADEGTQDDVNLPDTVWSILVYIFTMCDTYGYDLAEVDDLMSENQGWEYLACSGRHLCYEQEDTGARILHDFITR